MVDVSVNDSVVEKVSVVCGKVSVIDLVVVFFLTTVALGNVTVETGVMIDLMVLVRYCVVLLVVVPPEPFLVSNAVLHICCE